MLKIKSYIYWIIIAFISVSCENELDTSILWGRTDYYTDFLFHLASSDADNQCHTDELSDTVFLPAQQYALQNTEHG